MQVMPCYRFISWSSQLHSTALTECSFFVHDLTHLLQYFVKPILVLEVMPFKYLVLYMYHGKNE
jgi:hypothetical protein